MNHLMIGLTAGVLATTLTTIGFAQSATEDGQWSEPFDLPLISVHAATLPTGKVLLFGSEHGVPGVHGWVLDPQSLDLIDVPPGWDLNCSGHTFMADGELLVGGGTLLFQPLTGPRVAYKFDPFSLQWVQVEDMARGRWYPTQLTLGDGRTVTMSGLNDTTGELNPDIELYDPNSQFNWELIGQKEIPVYPLLHLMTNGLVFRAGPDADTETFDPVAVEWAPVGTTNFAGRYEAPSVLLPPSLDRVMLIGGYPGSGPPTNSAEIIDFSHAVPQWQGTAHMAFPRMEHDAVLMPDGTVLVVGGRSSSGGTAIPVLIPESFDPLTSVWDPLAPHRVPRMYHSTTILLPDARVLAAGGDFEPSGEIYSPSYLFGGPRPLILSAPAVVAYGSMFEVEFSSSAGPNVLTLIRLSSVTHSVNMGQRYVRLAENLTGGVSTAIAVPAVGDLGPPGYYMLFVVDNAGVPSVSRIVKVVAEFGQFDSDNDGVDDASDCDSGDPDAWSAPGEVGRLTLSHDIPAGLTTIAWPAPSTDLGGGSVAYDTLRSTVPSDFTASGSCIESGDVSDVGAQDSDSPGAGVAFFYLTRSRNSCAPGPLGFDSSGASRAGQTCP